MSNPIRMCKICRKHLPKDTLLRFIESNGKVKLDKTQKANTRGTYLCEECFLKAEKYKFFQREFKCEYRETIS